MGFLYINSKGQPWRKNSYSAGNTFDQSPLKYWLQKVQGWKEKDNKASFLFGRALEESIQFHHDHGGEGAVQDFANRWNAHKETKDLRYTKAEKDWQNLMSVGTDMIKLYTIRQPSLPIPLGGYSVFQRQYSKEVFPGDPTYGEIEDAGKLDIVSYVDPAHPALAKLDWRPEYGTFRPLIVDIKTAAADFPENPGMAAFDLQLRRYSWLSGIRDVSLLWFKKTSQNLQKGSSITVLKDVEPYKAGEEAVIAKVDKTIVPTSDFVTIDNIVWIVRNDFMLGEMEKAQGKKEDGSTDQTKAAKERAFEWLKQNGTAVATHEITKQRLQFNSGFVTIESANEAGEIAARQIVEIVNAWKRYKDSTPWPSTFGVRFPKDDRNDPYFRAFILRDEAFKKDYFTKKEEETIDDLFAEPDEGEE